MKTTAQRIAEQIWQDEWWRAQEWTPGKWHLMSKDWEQLYIPDWPREAFIGTEKKAKEDFDGWYERFVKPAQEMLKHKIEKEQRRRRFYQLEVPKLYGEEVTMVSLGVCRIACIYDIVIDDFHWRIDVLLGP